MAPSLPCGRLQRVLWLAAAVAVALVLVATAWGNGHARQAGGETNYSFPSLTGRVVDEANLLSPTDERALTVQSAKLEDRTGHQFVIATVKSLGGHPIEDYSLRLANFWGIGRKDVSDGVVLLVAPNERKVRIEVGYGLESVLTNAEAAHIIDVDMLPFFRRDAMAGGIKHGADAIVADLMRSKK